MVAKVYAKHGVGTIWRSWMRYDELQPITRIEPMSSVPAEMTVIEIAAPGGPEQLKPARRATPKPGEGEVLVRVAAAGVNRPDVMQRQGRYPPPAGASDIPGLEVAGEIVAIGPGASGVALGDEITALLPGGGYAEYAVAAAPLCLPVPKNFSMVEAAAVPETFFTSLGFTEALLTWTTAFSASADGGGTSTYSSTSGLPNVLN